MIQIRCADEAATFALGRRLGEVARPGTAVALDGDLGAGKTVFARGVGAGLAVATRVNSPTFVLVAQHEGRLPLWHADLYRLGDGTELDHLGLDQAIEGVLLVEWASRFAEALPDDHLAISLGIDGDAREVRIEARGPGHAWLIEALHAP